MLQTDREFFSPPQVAALLGVDYCKVSQFIHNGELRAVDLSVNRSQRPRYRISRADLEAFLARRSTSASPPAEKRSRKSDDVIQFYK